MMIKQQGFTLVELMIAVAIVGVLAAVAVPQYQTYVAKTQVTRAITEASALKVTVEDCLNNGLTELGSGAGQCDPAASGSDILTGSGQGSATIPSNAGVPQIALGAGTANSTIIATLGGHAAAAISGQAVTLTRDGNSGTWTCSFGGDIKYSPASCPGTATGG